MNEWQLSQQEILSLIGMERMEIMSDMLDGMYEEMEQQSQTEDK